MTGSDVAGHRCATLGPKALATRWRGNPDAHRRSKLFALAGLLLALTVAVTVLAADAVPTVDVSGVVLDTEGQPAEVESARVVEFETPDSEAVTAIDVAADGTFTVALREWGTPEAPASRASWSLDLEASRSSSTRRAAPRRPAHPGRWRSRSPASCRRSRSRSSWIRGGGRTVPAGHGDAWPEAPVASEAPAAVTTLPPTDAGGASRAGHGPDRHLRGLPVPGWSCGPRARSARPPRDGKLSPRTVSSTRRRRPRGR